MLHLSVGSQVDLQGGNRDEAGRTFAKVGTFFAVGNIADRAQSNKICSPRGLYMGTNALFMMTTPEPCNFYALDILRCDGRDIDVP